MNCTACGTMIPDGQTVCPACGAAVGAQPQMNYTQQPQMNYTQQPQMNYYQQQPQMGYQQQPQMGYQQQPQMGYQQPQMGYQQMAKPKSSVDVSAVANIMNGDLIKILAFIGALLMAFAPYVSWLSSNGKYAKMSMNLFGVAKSMDNGFMKFSLVVLVIVGIYLLFFELSKYIDSLKSINETLQKVPFLEAGLAAVALILMVICFFNGDLSDAADADKVSRGIGLLTGLFGFLLSAGANTISRLSK